jgi:serine/threonine protein kinase
VSGALDFIGPYRLVRLIRAGATCQVWEAVHDDGRRVALKMLQKEHRGNRDEMAYLQHEAEVGGELKHPNVIQIYEFVNERDLQALVLEIYNAKNLKQFIRQCPRLAEYLAPQIIEQAAKGLGHLHDKGWVHCDVKPDNFLVSDQGHVKLIDFAITQKPRKGLARLLSSFSKTVQGTRSYMSPEQIRGESLDARADLYSFGCMVYELLAGKPPFTAASGNDLLGKHLRSAPPLLAAANNNVTPEMTNLIAKLMAKKREDRPESMAAFLREFGRLRVYRIPPERPPEMDAAASDK